MFFCILFIYLIEFELYKSLSRLIRLRALKLVVAKFYPLN